MKRAFLERQHLSGIRARAFGTDAERYARAQPLVDDLQSLYCPLAIRAIDRDHVYIAHAESKHRRVEQLLFRDPSHAPSGESEERRRIEIGLMIRDKDVSPIWIEMLASCDVNFHSRQSEPRAC